VITIGIDPHKNSLTAVALDPSGRDLGQLRLRVTADVGRQLLAWAEAIRPTHIPDSLERRWAVEGAAGLGRGVALLLAADGEHVLDVPAKLAARARLLGSGNARKTDVTDAACVAAVWLLVKGFNPETGSTESQSASVATARHGVREPVQPAWITPPS
jgi:transposase